MTTSTRLPTAIKLAPLMICFLVSGLLASQVNAEDKTKSAWWKLSKSSSSSTGLFSNTSSTKYQGPKVGWPSFGNVGKATGNALSQAGKSTKQAWDSTVDFLNPWDDPKSKTQPRPKTKISTSSNKSSGWSLWGATEEPAKQSTVNDFLKLERPRF
jgi:hypothetical protein